MITKELLEQLEEFAKESYKRGEVYKAQGGMFYTLEKNPVEGFKLNKDWLSNCFYIHAERARNFKAIPLRCTIERDPESNKIILQKYFNLLTDELIDVDARLLNRVRVEDSDLYEFYQLPLRNYNDSEWEDDKILPIITRPLDLQEQHSKKENKIKLDL